MIGSTNSPFTRQEFSPVTAWKDIVGVKFEGDGSTIVATAGAWGSSGCASREKYTQWKEYLSLKAIVRNTTTVGMLGFSYNNSNATYSSIGWAFYQNGTGMEVYENGTERFKVSNALVAGDLIEVKADSTGTVTYLINGVVKYTSPTKITAAVLVDTAFLVANSAFNNVRIHGAVA